MFPVERKKLEGNGFWESSRILLPEHRRAAKQLSQEQKRRQRIEYDDQELEQFGRVLAESKELGQPVTIKLFDEREHLVVIGIVDRLDPYKRRFMVDGEWFCLADVEGVE
ncbi:YolD-like family protein [Paenibacillaceae bacterium]|nr:YolD-like family protein [Paenibacillaceae bacterium]